MECDAVRERVGELEKTLAALHDALKVNEEDIQEPDSQVAADAKSIDHLATLVMDYFSKCLFVTAENGEFWRGVNDLEGKTRVAIASAKQFQADVSFVTGECDNLSAKIEELALALQCMPGLAKEARSLRACAVEIEIWFKTKASKMQA